MYTDNLFTILNNHYIYNVHKEKINSFIVNDHLRNVFNYSLEYYNDSIFKMEKEFDLINDERTKHEDFSYSFGNDISYKKAFMSNIDNKPTSIVLNVESNMEFFSGSKHLGVISKFNFKFENDLFTINLSFEHFRDKKNFKNNFKNSLKILLDDHLNKSFKESKIDITVEDLEVSLIELDFCPISKSGILEMPDLALSKNKELCFLSSEQFSSLIYSGGFTRSDIEFLNLTNDFFDQNILNYEVKENNNIYTLLENNSNKKIKLKS